MKRLLLMAGLLNLFISCNSEENTKQHETLIKSYFERFNKHEWSQLADMYAEVSECKDPSLGEGVIKQTRQQIVEKYSGLNKMFPDVKDEIKQIYYTNDNHIVVEFVSSGTSSSGSSFKLPICTIFTVEKGKITRDFTYYDNFSQE